MSLQSSSSESVLGRQNYHQESESAINKQINLELSASYQYMAMASHFGQQDVALNGFRKFFEKQSEEEREHAMKLTKPQHSQFDSGLHAMNIALEMEKVVNQSLLELHKTAEKHSDSQLTDFLEGEYLKEQVRSIYEISQHVTNLKRVGPGLGEYLFDQNSLNTSDTEN